MGLVVLVLNYFLLAIQVILFIYMILSWVELANRMSSSVPRLSMGNPFVRFIYDTAEAILRPIRKVLQPYQRDIPIDLSFIAAIILIELVRSLLRQFMYY